MGDLVGDGAGMHLGGAPPDLRAAASDRRLLLVVGSGRSGTSVLAGTLQRLGMHVPQPEVPANDSNPYGFAEPQWVVDFHTRQLSRIGVQVADGRPEAWMRGTELAFKPGVRSRLAEWLEEQFEVSSDLVLKDPRLVWFVPLWAAVAEDLGVTPRFATMVRHPAEVVASKQRWYSKMDNPTYRLAGWVNTMLIAERATREYQRAFIPFDGILADWARQVGRLDAAVGIPAMNTSTSRQIRDVMRGIDPELRRSRESWNEIQVPDGLRALADQLWDHLAVLATSTSTDDEVTSMALESLRDSFEELYLESEAIAYSSVMAEHRKGSARQRKKAIAEKKGDSVIRPDAAGSKSAGASTPPSIGQEPVSRDVVRRFARSARDSVRRWRT